MPQIATLGLLMNVIKCQIIFLTKIDYEVFKLFWPNCEKKHIITLSIIMALTTRYTYNDLDLFLQTLKHLSPMIVFIVITKLIEFLKKSIIQMLHLQLLLVQYLS